MTIAARPTAATIHFVWKMRGRQTRKERWRARKKLGDSRSAHRPFSADKYEPSPYVCQACKHHILCLSFRSLARCGRMTVSQERRKRMHLASWSAKRKLVAPQRAKLACQAEARRTSASEGWWE